MSFWKSTLVNNLVNEGQFPEVPVAVEVPSKTWVQLTAVAVVLISFVVIGVLLTKNS